MTADLLTYGVPSLVAIMVGIIAGAVVALRIHRKTTPPVADLVADVVADDDEEFIDSEIDLAAIEWAEAKDLPPAAAGLMAARLKTLHKIGKGKGWFE